jgi:hypothetical protein
MILFLDGNDTNTSFYNYLETIFIHVLILHSSSTTITEVRSWIFVGRDLTKYGAEEVAITRVPKLRNNLTRIWTVK